MRAQIIDYLHSIEEKENVKILYAAEAGSRAHGLSSPASDYDVRFVYIRPREFYLRLENCRDTLEYSDGKSLDISGWDIVKVLKATHNSNASVFEWFKSPVVYVNSEFGQAFKETMERYYSQKKCLHHYLSLSFKFYNEYIDKDVVVLKKYFSVLRPLLSCKWICDKNCPPPIDFKELMDAEMEGYIKTIVDELINLKTNNPQPMEIQKISELNAYIALNLKYIEKRVFKVIDIDSPGWEELNRLFVNELNKQDANVGAIAS